MIPSLSHSARAKANQVIRSPSAPPVVAPTPAAPSGPAGDPWIVHSAELDRAWKHTQETQLTAIASWAPNALGPAYQTSGTMFYMFSGPDFLYAHAFFPNARTYILCGNEPVGALPDLTTLPPEILPGALGNIRKSLESVLSWSFFITKNMKSDLTQPYLSGTLPLLYVFLARANCTIDSVTPVTIDGNGVLAERASDQSAKGVTPGVRIVFRNASDNRSSIANSAASTLYYFCTDLSDDGIKSTPGLLRFCQRAGRGVSLLKAASYLMHETGFSLVRQFLLGQSDIIVQDDSGIPFRFFEPEIGGGTIPAGQSWDIHYYGPYLGPIDVFKQYWQQDLADVYARVPGQPLPFGFGYQWQATKSNLMVASRR